MKYYTFVFLITLVFWGFGHREPEIGTVLDNLNGINVYYNGPVFSKVQGRNTVSYTHLDVYKRQCYTYPGPGTYLVTLKNLTSICGFKPVTKEIILNPKLEINPIPTSYICEETEMTFNANANICLLYTSRCV